jgi:hypothetical protein
MPTSLVPGVRGMGGERAREERREEEGRRRRRRRKGGWRMRWEGSDEIGGGWGWRGRREEVRFECDEDGMVG